MVLAEKCPTLCSYCTKRFAEQIVALYREAGTREQFQKGMLSTPVLLANEVDSIKLLIRVALLDRGQQFFTYPEFVGRLKNSHKFHPIHRLSFWVRYIFTKSSRATSGSSSSSSSSSTSAPSAEFFNSIGHRLSALDVVDQTGFPKVRQDLTPRSDLSRGPGLSLHGDYSNLSWMIETVKHGYAGEFRYKREGERQ
jgi:hypothetical protein